MSRDKWRGEAFGIGDLYVKRHQIVSKDFFPKIPYSSSTVCPLNMGPIDRPKTSEYNYQHTLETLDKSENLENYTPNAWKVSLRFKYISEALCKYIHKYRYAILIRKKQN